jgi:hypothetical protein
MYYSTIRLFHQQASRLHCLHNVLELFVLAKGFADVPHGSIRELVG